MSSSIICIVLVPVPTKFVEGMNCKMNFDIIQRNYIADLTESIYSVTMTTRENQLRSSMRHLRQLLIFDEEMIEASSEQASLSTCLWFAVLDRDAKSVRALMRHNPDVNSTREDLSMLWMAVVRGDMEIAKMLVNAGAEVNERVAEGGPTFLHFLATMGDDKDSLDLAKMMIERGADVNARVAGYNVLQIAVMYETTSLIEQLLKHGANCRPVDLLPLAAQGPHSSAMLLMLVDSIEDGEEKLVWAFRSLQHLIENGDVNLKAIETLVRLNLSVLELEIDGWTVLRTAVHFGKLEVIRLLLDHGAKN